MESKKANELPLRLLAIALSVGIGASVGIIAVALFLVTGFFTKNWSQKLLGSTSLEYFPYHPVVGISLLLSAVIAGQIILLIENRKPQGPADLILSAQSDSDLNVKAGILSSLIASVSLSGGASVGFFGPLVHLGGCLGSYLNTRSKLLSKDVALGIGAGAAISAVFATPIGAAVFAHEAIIRRFGNLGAGPVLSASFAAYWVSNLILGDHQLFAVDSVPHLDIQTLFSAITIGIICGLVSTLYMKSIIKTSIFASSAGIPIALRPLVPACVLFMISPLLPQLLGSGMSTIALSMSGALSLGIMLALLAGKIAATSLCIGFGYFGGVFGPALFIGAMVGGCADAWIAYFDMGPPTTSYAVLGACCCIAAVIGAPIASVLIAYELTGSYEWAVLSMIGVVTCTQVSRSLAGRSLFDLQLKLRGLEMQDDKPAFAATQKLLPGADTQVTPSPTSYMPNKDPS